MRSIFTLVFACLIPCLIPTAVVHANTIYRVAHVRTFDQTGNCMCAVYSVFHALEVRNLQKAGTTKYLNPKSVQWSQVFDRYNEQVHGFRSNATLDSCFTESPYPHDVIRQIQQYGSAWAQPSDIEHIDGFTHDRALELNQKITAEPTLDQKVTAIRAYLVSKLGQPIGQLDVTKEVLGSDQWLGYVPSEVASGTGIIPFLPPADFSNELPMPEHMPQVTAMPRAEILKKVVASIQAGVPAVFCAGPHCQSLDGVELDAQGQIVEFLYAGSYGTDQFTWGEVKDAKNVRNAFVYLILQP